LTQVDDAAARECARWFYARVLGLRSPDEANGVIGTSPPATIGEALREARRNTFAFSAQSSSWGAYQHYGRISDKLLPLPNAPANPIDPLANSLAGASGALRRPIHADVGYDRTLRLGEEATKEALLASLHLANDESGILKVSDEVRASFEPIMEALGRVRDDLSAAKDVVTVRPGYGYPPTGKPVPAIVVAVTPGTHQGFQPTRQIRYRLRGYRRNRRRAGGGSQSRAPCLLWPARRTHALDLRENDRR
jgi:hypothetical protein